MSGPTRADLAHQALWWAAISDEAKARANAIRVELEIQARTELERDGIAPTWRIPGLGTVPLSLSQDRAEVIDEAALTTWVAAHHPTEVETVTRIRGAYRELLLKALAQTGEDCCTTDGTRPPGVVFRPGGQPRGLSIRASAAAKAAAAELAAAFLDRATPKGAQA